VAGIDGKACASSTSTDVRPFDDALRLLMPAGLRHLHNESRKFGPLARLRLSLSVLSVGSNNHQRLQTTCPTHTPKHVVIFCYSAVRIGEARPRLVNGWPSFPLFQLARVLDRPS
jgi:hypothetical protein